MNDESESLSKSISRAARASRGGATIVESAITLPVTLLVLFAILDLGLAATRYNALAEVSRRIAREAVLHGALAPTSSESWGPDVYVGTMAASSEVVAAAQGMTPTMDANDVLVRVTWPDNDNSPRDRVHVEVTYQHDPLLPAICPWGPISLRSVTTMHIVN